MNNIERTKKLECTLTLPQNEFMQEKRKNNMEETIKFYSYPFFLFLFVEKKNFQLSSYQKKSIG